MSSNAKVAWGLALLATAACTKDDPSPPKLLDTGWFDTATVPRTEDCTDLLLTTEPEDGEVGWYWRDSPTAYVSDESGAYDVWLEKPSGERIPTTVEWDGVVAKLQVQGGWLEANTDYVFAVQDCAGTHEIAFRTSEFGRPLASGPETLEDRTFLLDLAAAEWTEPALLASLIREYFNTPVLLGIRYVDETQIDILGALGLTDELGNVSQDFLSPSWDFPLTDFTTSPYLETRVDRITLQYSDAILIDIPVEDFLLQLTFSADGTRVGGGVLSGLADSRNLGALFDSDDPDALCQLAEPLTVECVPCSDGMPYCLRIVGEDLEGEIVPGLTLVEIGG